MKNKNWLYVVILLAAACYPANWMMMKQGVGIYNNDPKAEWNMVRFVLHGPSQGWRTASLIISPITAPISGIAVLSESTIPKEPDTSPIPDSTIQIKK